MIITTKANAFKPTSDETHFNQHFDVCLQPNVIKLFDVRQKFVVLCANIKFASFSDPLSFRIMDKLCMQAMKTLIN